jgi:hypothetical protein
MFSDDALDRMGNTELVMSNHQDVIPLESVEGQYRLHSTSYILLTNSKLDVKSSTGMISTLWRSGCRLIAGTTDWRWCSKLGQSLEFRQVLLKPKNDKFYTLIIHYLGDQCYLHLPGHVLPCFRSPTPLLGMFEMVSFILSGKRARAATASRCGLQAPVKAVTGGARGEGLGWGFR